MRALTIGNFDGVHRGHQALVARARTLVGDHGDVVALAFDPHPTSILRPGSEPSRLSTFDQRERWLRDAGADRVIRLVPTPEFLSLTADEFVKHLVAEYRPTHIVEGPDFHFGKGRGGNVHTLQSLGPSLGFETSLVEGVDVTLSDHLIAPASSTMTRWLLANGRVRDAAIVLGRPYILDGVVVRGDRRGRQLGFPTANIHTPTMLPADGVYACRAVLTDGRTLLAAVHVGPRATFDSFERTVEAHLLDAPIERDADGTARLAGLSEYGWGISLHFIAWIREQIAFSSVESLIKRIHADCDQARSLIDKPFTITTIEGAGASHQRASA